MFVCCCPGRCGSGCIVRDVVENGEGRVGGVQLLQTLSIGL